MKWFDEKGPESEIVLSTRIRLARNISRYPFPCRLDAKGRNKITDEVWNALSDGSCGSFSMIRMDKISRIQAISLAERHLITPEFTSRLEGTALMMTEDEGTSIMVCEDDHLRLQVVMPGLSLEDAFAKADKIDTFLDEKFGFAFDENMGYLTQCPANIGTAMKASVMLHLPALTRCGRISRLAGTVSKLGLVLRGAYSEGSSPAGDIYQLSNQITLGISEEAAVSNLKSIAMQLVNQEKALAAEYAASPLEEDRIYRALGLLKYARSMSNKEFMELLSLVRMGCANGVLDIAPEVLGGLLINLQPATVSAANPDASTQEARDRIRADAVRKALE